MNTRIAKLLLAGIAESKMNESGIQSEGYAAAIVAINQIKTAAQYSDDLTQEESAFLDAERAHYRAKFDAAIAHEDAEC